MKLHSIVMAIGFAALLVAITADMFLAGEKAKLQRFIITMGATYSDDRPIEVWAKDSLWAVASIGLTVWSEERWNKCVKDKICKNTPKPPREAAIPAGMRFDRGMLTTDSLNQNFERLRVAACAETLPHKWQGGDFINDRVLSENFGVIVKALKRGGCK